MSKARKQFEITRRKAVVADLYLKGKKIHVIAEELGLSPAVISKDLSDLRSQWRAEAKVDYDTKILDELARLQKVEEKAWEGWEKSFGDVETRTTKTKCYKEKMPGKKDNYRLIPYEEVTDHSVKGQSGNPDFLNQIERVITLRLKLLGALDPDVTQNVNVINVNWNELTKKPQERQNALEEALRELREQASPKALSDNGEYRHEGEEGGDNGNEEIIESTVHRPLHTE
jgi:hypothetical protein